MKKNLSLFGIQEEIDNLQYSYNTLLGIELFSELSKEELLHFCSIISKKSFKVGETIAEVGSSESRFYIIRDGIVEISKKTISGEPYVFSILNEDGKGAFFGEMALIEDSPRTANIYAKTGVLTYYVDRDDFIKFCDKNPIIGYKIVKILARAICRHIRKSNEDILILFNALVSETERDITDEEN